MTTEEVLSRFQGVRPAGSRKWKARCPAHEDKDPSLSISEKDGKTLLKCHAGCATAEILKRAGLEMRDLFTANSTGRRKGGPKGREVKAYDYVDEAGALLYQNVRYEPKDFNQRRPDGKGGWIWNLNGTQRVPYNLPGILQATAEGKRVWIFEGEKDSDTAAGLGLPATSSKGWGSDWEEVLAKYLAGPWGVFIGADADAAGRKLAHKVALALYGKVGSLKVFELPGAKDLTEWVSRGGTFEALVQLAHEAPEWTPADGAHILDEVMRFVRRFVSMTDDQARVVALWLFHSHAFEAAVTTPYLAINSAEKQSGKTRLLEILGRGLLVANPWFTGRVSTAVLVRKIDAESPTLLLDESDAAFSGNKRQAGPSKEYAEALRGILNSGYRRGGVASLCVGQGANITYKDFSTFCPKAIAGIGQLPDTVADRSIPIRLKRAPRGTVERFCERETPQEGYELGARVGVWCTANLERLRDARPEIPAQLSDRQADCCEPLLAIADLAGGDWPAAARPTLVELCAQAQQADGSISVRLLGELQRIFSPIDDNGKSLTEVERISSSDLAAALGAIEGGPWQEWGKFRKPITPNQLAQLLARYDIRPKNIRFPDERVLKGYERAQFVESWALYLPSESPKSSCTPDSNRYTATTRINTGEDGISQSATAGPCSGSENAVSTNKDAPCSGVADQNQGEEEETAKKKALTEVEWEA
jgi:hypothetical protein